MKGMFKRAWPIGLVIVAVAIAAAIAAEAEARPGGGHSYSGGSSSSGGGGGWSGGGSSSGGGDGDLGLLIYLLVRLIVEVPIIGVPLVIAIIVAVYFHHKHKSETERSETWDSAPAPVHHHRPRRGDLGKIRALDPEFSAVLFTDFVYALYARVHMARGDEAAMEALAPYVAPESREALLARDPQGVPVSGVVIGAMTVEKVEIGRMIEVELAFEANYSAQLPGGAQGYYVSEVWRLQRSAEAVSKPPETATSLGCPNCGAPLERSDAGRCRFCGQQVEGGRFDWSLCFVRLRGQELRPPPLATHAEEVGTDDRTLFAPNIQQAHQALVAEDPSAGPEKIEQRVRAIYAALNEGWTNLDLRRARPFVSDSLFNYLQYWIDAYKAQGLRNVLKDMQLTRLVIVKLERDKHFDALTVRIWGRGMDYTVQTVGGQHVSGSQRFARSYSEYWTLIRGAKVHGTGRDPAQCPNCGAGLDRVNMAGTCEYCGAHLTRGEFDWVLSKIEQDEAYVG